LFVGAMVPARYNPQLKNIRDKLAVAEKPKLIALAAVTRKLIAILNAILQDRRPWQHPPDDQISRLRLPLWTSIGKAEPSP
jgi:hypothetical protein